jgi:RND family efflux transporter MFP subunit
MLRRVLIGFSALAVLAVGAAGMNMLIGLRNPPPRQIVDNPGPVVRVVKVEPRDVPLSVAGFGTVRAKHVWSVAPEVSGTIVELSPQLRAGLHVKRGDLLFDIDPRSFRLAVQRIQARLIQHEKEIAVLWQQRKNHLETLELARQNLSIAEEDLRRDEALVRKGTISPRERDRRQQARNEALRTVQSVENQLALNGPRVEQAEAAIEVARAELEEAELRLSKTRLLAPADGQFMHTTLDLGEFVTAGREVASLYGTDAVEIPIAVPMDELRWLPTLSPDHFSPTADSTPAANDLLPAATVHWQGGQRDYAWHGKVVRWEAGLDARTRTLTLVVEVPKPWDSFRPGEHPALQPGMFCRVEISAGSQPNAVVIPRTALHDGNSVHLVTDGRLVRRQVQVLRFLRDQAILSAGLQSGDQLVVSPLSAPVIGMKLRALEVEPVPPAIPATQDTVARQQER